MLQPCDPDATIWLLRQAFHEKPEDVDLEVAVELVAQLVADLRGWSLPTDPGCPNRRRLASGERSILEAGASLMPRRLARAVRTVLAP